MLFNLTNYHFVQDEMMRKYLTDLNMFSPKNFVKMGARDVGVVVSFVTFIYFLFA